VRNEGTAEYHGLVQLKNGEVRRAQVTQESRINFCCTMLVIGGVDRGVI